MPRQLDQSYNDLVEKAQALFWIQGYKGTTVQDLADHLDVSTTVIYNKYTKESLFLDSINYYTSTCSDPFLSQLRESTEGKKGLRSFFLGLVEALESKVFPRSCLMVNTLVELRNENSEVVKLYEKYFHNLVESYRIVIDKAVQSGEIKEAHRRDEYADFLLGMIFGISILFKTSGPDACEKYIDEQLSLIN